MDFLEFSIGFELMLLEFLPDWNWNGEILFALVEELI